MFISQSHYLLAFFEPSKNCTLNPYHCEIPLIPLPDEKYPAYLFRYKDGASSIIIYVDKQKYTWNYNFRLFIGKVGEMKELKVTDVRRLRDGGTTYIHLEDRSVLFAPAARRGKIPTWIDSNGQKIEIKRLQVGNFRLEDLGISGVPSPEKALKTPCELVTD